MFALRPAAPSRTELASWPKEKADAFLAEEKALYASVDAAERNVVLDLISYLVLTGSAAGREIARGFFDEAYGVLDLRTRAAVVLFKRGEREDLECLSRHLDDRDSIVRENAIRSILTLDIGSAWERLGGDRLVHKGAEAEADELLFVLGRDLTAKGGDPVRGWANQEPRFIELARKLLKNRKIKNADLVLHGLGEKV